MSYASTAQVVKKDMGTGFGATVQSSVCFRLLRWKP